MKKLLFFICTLLCANVLWAQTFWVDSLQYRVISINQVEVVEVYDAIQSITTVDIPTTVTYNGTSYSVTSIGNSAFYNCSSLTSVNIPNSITSIGDYAFKSCLSLTSIDIPNSVTSIGDYSFSSCHLTSVDIPNSVVSIGAGAFSSSHLTSVTIQNGVVSINAVAFAGNSLTSVVIPNSVTFIGNRAFEDCRRLSFVTLPQNATISNSAFKNAGSNITIDNIIYNCSDSSSITVGNYTFNNVGVFLTFYLNGISYNSSIVGEELMVYWFDENISNDVIIPPTINFNENVYSITSIDSYAFSNCSILNSITIPNSITSIGENAFYNCGNLTSVTCLGNNAPLLGNNAFQNTPLNKVLYFPFCSMENYATSDWSNYFDISIKEGNLTYALNNDNTLKVMDCVDSVVSVVIPSNISNETCSYNVTEIGDSAFANCSSLTSITIPNSVTSIASYAFSNCSGLTTLNFNAINCSNFNSNHHFADCPISTINIGDSVQRIPANFAYNLDSLISITIPNSVTSIEDSAFYGCSSLTTLNFNAINCSDFSSSNRPFADSPISTINIGDNVQRIPNYFAYNNSLITSINVSNSVTSIGENSFNGCSNVLSIGLGNSVVSIGDSAFYGCSNITSIDIPNSVAEIGADAFNGCDMMMLVNLGENLSFIGSNAFNGCAFLQSVNCLATIPPTLQGSSVFPNPNIATLTVPCGSLEAYSSPTSFWNILFNGRIEEDCSSDSGLEDFNAVDISFFPNPTSGKVTFNQAIERIELIDLAGKTLRTYENESEINIEQLPAGVYYLRLTNNEKQTLRKLIKE